jgi:hypothetical protein
MGYITIMKELNEMEVMEVFCIIEALASMGGMYKSFTKHLLNDEVLADKFFEVDEEFNPTKNNLREMMKKSMYSDEIDDSVDFVKSDEESNLEKLYKEYQKKELEINPQKKPSTNISNFINKEAREKIHNFKKNLDYSLVNWIELNIPKMSDEEYGMFMTLIAKTREDGGR